MLSLFLPLFLRRLLILLEHPGGIVLGQDRLGLLNLLRLLLLLELLGGRDLGLGLCRVNLLRLLLLRFLPGERPLGLDLRIRLNLFHLLPLMIQGGSTNQRWSMMVMIVGDQKRTTRKREVMKERQRLKIRL